MKKGVEDFVVESTPVLDLKKGGISQLTRQEGVGSDQNWDSDRTEVYADVDGDNVVATLVGENGERFPITTFPFVMGRGSDCDLVLQGKGVSRRHAEIVFQAGRFVINDFDSLNGLKINGYKVSRVILEENDVIKFGEVTLTFRSGGGETANQEGSANTGKKKSLFSKDKNEKKHIAASEDDTFGPGLAKKVITGVLAFGAFALVGVAGFQFWQQSQQGENVVLVSGGAGNAQSRTSTSAAATPAPAGVESSAVNEQKEQAASVETKPAVVADPAIAPPPSIAPPASIARMPEPASKAPTVAATPEQKQMPASSKAQKQSTPMLAREPEKTVPKAPPRVDDSGKARVAAAEAERLYFSGRAEAAIAQLSPFVSNNNVQLSVRNEIKQDFESFNDLHSQYLAAQSAYTSGDKERAFVLWTQFMDNESRLFSGKRSTYSKSISARVVDEYVDLGNEAARAGDNLKAYKMWSKAVELGDNVAARIAIDNANNKGMQLYRQALRLEYVNTSKAKALWQEVTQILPPGTEYHTKASAKLAWYDKWGT